MRLFPPNFNFNTVKEIGTYRNRGFKKDPFHTGINALLPEAYRRYWAELNETPTPVHYRPEEGEWKTDRWGVVQPVQNIPIPLKYPEEFNKGLWGGEAVIQGFRQEGNKYTRRVAAWWIPSLRQSVLYSEVLRKHMQVMVTDRLIDQVHKNQGLDKYLLNSRACDISSKLALYLKRKILFTIRDNTYTHTGDDLEYIKRIYDPYLEQYDPEYIEWYGLSFQEAREKMRRQLEAQIVVRPLKDVYRENLFQGLKSGTVDLEPTKPQEDGSLLAYPSKLIGKAKSKLFSS